MAIEGKGCASCTCCSMIVTSVLELILLFALIFIVVRDLFEDEYRSHQEDLLIFAVVVLGVVILAVVGLRSNGAWKLWQSLEQCETEPEEALKYVSMCFTLEIIACVVCVVVTIFSFFLPLLVLILPDFGFLCCIQNFHNRIQSENYRQGNGMMMMSGVLPDPMMLPVYGYGNGPPWSLTSNNVVYPMAPYNVPNNADVPPFPQFPQNKDQDHTSNYKYNDFTF